MAKPRTPPFGVVGIMGQLGRERGMQPAALALKPNQELLNPAPIRTYDDFIAYSQIDSLHASSNGAMKAA